MRVDKIVHIGVNARRDIRVDIRVDTRVDVVVDT